ncbi:hypothetical protein ID866_7342 [Astraeus odoratus]|nr:hypothetical protein ID866_7342 [Astraeus odoratus]
MLPSAHVQSSAFTGHSREVRVDPANFVLLHPSGDVRRQALEDDREQHRRATNGSSLRVHAAMERSSPPSSAALDSRKKSLDGVPEPSTNRITFKPFPDSAASNSQRQLSKNDAVTPQRLLKPYDLALELREMWSKGDTNGAIHRLKNTPRDAQNAAVWNTMISLCVQAGKYQRSYELFTDMKRRGFTPNAATFSTLLKGLTQVTDWSKHPKQLANVHTLYEYYIKHIESVKYHEPENISELSSAPVALYLTILGNIGDRQKIFDVFFAMDTEGSVVPDKYVFCAIFDAITKCYERSSTSNDEISLSGSAKPDAKYIWLQVEKAAEKQGKFDLDSHVIASAIRALTRGRSSDQALALDIAMKHLRLVTFGERPAPRLSRLLTPWTLDATLTLCNTMQKYRLCVHFMRQVIERLDIEKPHWRNTIDKNHFQKLLRAHAALARRGSRDESLQALEAVEWCIETDAVYRLPQLRPDRQTYHLLFMTCWRNADWARAMRTFELMTGIRATAYHESNRGQQPPKLLVRPASNNISPDLVTMSFLMRTALATRELAHYQQAMWLADHVDLSAMLRDSTADAFYRTRVARPLIPIITRLEGEVPADRYQGWSGLLRQAEELVHDIDESSEEDKRLLGKTWNFREIEDGAI